MKENMIKTCKHCNIEFNLYSRLKKQVGGYINECPDCVEELGGDQSPPKHFGVTGSAGAAVKRLTRTITPKEQIKIMADKP